MKIRSVELRPFRNFDHGSFAFEAERTLIMGRNGRGKTNILEAISFLSIGRSVRGAQDQQAVPYNGAFFDVTGTCVAGERVQHLRLFFDRLQGKKVFDDDGPLERVADLLGRFRTVHFAPEDVSLVLRFPGQRRRLLDILISQRSPEYLRALQRYQRVLAQRNALLRGGMTAGGSGLATWTEQLAAAGGVLRRERLDAIAALQGPFREWARRLAPDDGEASIAYRGASCGDGAQELVLLDQLRARSQQEREVGYTLVGPHRDDLTFALDDRPVHAYGSEGQLKSVLIAWKLAEVLLLQNELTGQPVLLLDDVLSELDEARAAALMDILDGFEQVILSSPRPLGGEPAGRFQCLALEG